MTDKFVLDIDAWHTFATALPRTSSGLYRISEEYYTEGYYEYYGLDGHILFRVARDIPITLLQQGSGGYYETWMVDDPPHVRAMELYAERASGRVLVAGLGLGLVASELACNPNVSEVVIVERSSDVINLVGNAVLDVFKETNIPLEIIHADFIDTVVSCQQYPPTREYNTIIVDLWVAHGIEEKRQLLVKEVMPLVIQLNEAWPLACKIYHGFQQVSDIKLVTDRKIVREVAKVAEMIRGEGG